MVYMLKSQEELYDRSYANKGQYSDQMYRQSFN